MFFKERNNTKQKTPTFYGQGLIAIRKRMLTTIESHLNLLGLDTTNYVDINFS